MKEALFCSAGILAAIAALIFVTQNALLIALALVGAGAYLLTRKRASSVAVAEPARDRQAALRKWRSNLAKLTAQDQAEILSDVQLETLVNSPAATLEELHGTLSPEQIARYGNQLLEVLGSNARPTSA